jgi:fatty-acid desaturase
MDYVVAVLLGLGLAEVATLVTTIYLHRVRSRKSIQLYPALTNHHARPASSKLSVFRGEFEPAWPVIRFLVASGSRR